MEDNNNNNYNSNSIFDENSNNVYSPTKKIFPFLYQKEKKIIQILKKRN